MKCHRLGVTCLNVLFCFFVWRGLAFWDLHTYCSVLSEKTSWCVLCHSLVGFEIITDSFVLVSVCLSLFLCKIELSACGGKKEFSSLLVGFFGCFLLFLVCRLQILVTTAPVDMSGGTGLCAVYPYSVWHTKYVDEIVGYTNCIVIMLTNICWLWCMYLYWLYFWLCINTWVCHTLFYPKTRLTSILSNKYYRGGAPRQRALSGRLVNHDQCSLWSLHAVGIMVAQCVVCDRSGVAECSPKSGYDTDPHYTLLHRAPVH